MSGALQRLSEEDPTFRVFTDEETGQTIIAGMGELHLEILRDRMLREHKVETDAGKPQIAYRETITQNAEGEGKLVKQSGGRGQYGHVVLRIATVEKGKGITVESKVVGGTIPKEFIQPAINGVKEAVLNGIIAGYPVVDLHVEIYDGSYHDVDSNENAFKMAGIFALKDALKKAKCILLEPIMAVEAVTPETNQGDIMGDLNRRRGRIGGIDSKNGLAMIKAEVPLAEMFGYSTAIRTLSSGRASYTMEPAKFEEVPRNIVEQIIESRGGKKDKE
jgi:elongation factor G